MTIKEDIEAYRIQGRNCFESGLKLEENPFTESNNFIAFLSWREGFLSAMLFHARKNFERITE